MTSSLRRDIEHIYRAALAPVRAGNAVRSNVQVADDGTLLVGGERVVPGAPGVYCLAIGKAAVGMIDAAASQLGPRMVAGLAVSKSEEPSSDLRIEVLHGAHPVPDERSLAAGEAVLRFAATVPSGAIVICLISGGGSALVERLRDSVDLDRLQDVTSTLLKAGASIHELNAIRSLMSRIKAGGLLASLRHARVYNLIVSDVLGDSLPTIASGPTVPPSDQNAGQVMRNYSIDGPLPKSEPAGELALPPTTIVASLSIAIDAAARAAAELGYAPVVLSRSIEGEAKEAGRFIASIVADTAEGRTTFGRRTCLLAGGETTVTVRGTGLGGRNTEAALAAAIRLMAVENVALGFLATDGDDGETGAAGAIVDGTTVQPEDRIVAGRALTDNDTYAFLRERGAGVVTGPSGTNVNDLVIGLIG